MCGPHAWRLGFAAAGCCRIPRTVPEVCHARWGCEAVGLGSENDSCKEVQTMRYKLGWLWLTRLLRGVKRRQGNVFIEKGIWIVIV
jgi:hypothetical protein